MAPKRLSDHRHTFQFPIGALVFSEGIDRAMRECGLDPLPQFRRHARADWGTSRTSSGKPTTPPCYPVAALNHSTWFIAN